mmetsp:Transcript_31021/g.64725  ORF Transcript_31021/g.64725 Transcript_31021/m.64725 type:complete len:241 (-) Transcript_31021:44-766(-)
MLVLIRSIYAQSPPLGKSSRLPARHHGGNMWEMDTSLARTLSSKRQRLKPSENKRPFEFDNLTENRKKAKEMENKIEGIKEVSRSLKKCRTYKEFVNFAKNSGAIISISGSHVKISKNSITTGVHSTGKKFFVKSGIRKSIIDAFKAMGIAWDAKISTERPSRDTVEEIHALLLQEGGELGLSKFTPKFIKKYGKSPLFEKRDGRQSLRQSLEALSRESGRFHVKLASNGGWKLCLTTPQ